MSIVPYSSRNETCNFYGYTMKKSDAFEFTVTRLHGGHNPVREFQLGSSSIKKSLNPELTFSFNGTHFSAVVSMVGLLFAVNIDLLTMHQVVNEFLNENSPQGTNNSVSNGKEKDLSNLVHISKICVKASKFKFSFSGEKKEVKASVKYKIGFSVSGFNNDNEKKRVKRKLYFSFPLSNYTWTKK